MFFTFIKDINNVWYNDAHKLTLFYNIFLIILHIFFIKNFFSSIIQSLKALKKSNIFMITKSLIIYILVIINLLFFVLGGVGLFQIIIEDRFDALIRSFGIFMVTTSLILHLRFSKKHHGKRGADNLITHGFFEIVRHPEYLILFLLSLGLACCFISLGGFLFTFVQIPVTIFVCFSEENDLIKVNENYYDFRNETPKIIPETRMVLKKVL